MPAVYDPTQQAEGDAAQWAREPIQERHKDLVAHTERPFNAEPPNRALQEMITPETLHYRRQHTPVPDIDEGGYRLSIGFDAEGGATKEMRPGARTFSVKDLRDNFPSHDLVVTLMCTGNRRSEMNSKEDGETMGLPWKNGSISTAKWSGVLLLDVLKSIGMDADRMRADGYRFLTFWGLEDYHVSIPMKKAFDVDGDCALVWAMNGKPLPRDHGFPLRVIVPGFVGARSVKWLDRIVFAKNEVDGMHQTGIAYKCLGPNQKVLSAVPKEEIHALPPVDHVPVTSAITAPEPGARVGKPGETFEISGYAYSGAGCAIIRVDVSLDGGRTWAQAKITERASATTQGIRSGRAWAWVQWRHAGVVPKGTTDAGGGVTIVCKAVDDQYNQQPHEVSPIWNLRGILNNAWPRVQVQVGGPLVDPAAKSGDGTINNVGIKLDGQFQCAQCRQRFSSEAGRTLHINFIHAPPQTVVPCAPGATARM